MTTLDTHWFTEICEEGGSAFSLRIKRKLHEEQSPYQRIEIFETEKFGNLMVIDGFVMLTGRDNFLYHEMMSHPALFTHPDPKRVVIIGGGDCGTLREVLRHDGIEHALQVEIDERVTRISEKFFPELCESNNDPRAEFYFGDGIKWMAEAAPGSVDVVIVDSTDPIGPAKGLFTEAFYRDCFNAMGGHGVLVQQSESPLYHMRILKPMHAAMRAAGFDDTASLFYPQPVYPSGWWTATLAVKGGPAGEFREQAAADKSFETVYYNAGLHRGALAMPEFFRKALED
ncbi:polyamine aminopropyltransferase [Thiohalobacter sp. COW1]|uniref:Polyamine aminopropyltransferase n=1 Tax=Thiohalobacter thiocyanaticus TaxID=585455 RepID=A0A1Z4VM38_9GAMM|nr:MULTISPECIES: polyamine aminopropyltransferase [Thiohalobacter]BAZ92502.1 spermidine synthase [Thiohalobacter thiocyanaticus]BCO32513.1 polyamine aminopropyltransferase [Thiohalobacter sp. COW1]